VADTNLRWEAWSVSATASPDGLVREATPTHARAIATVHVATYADPACQGQGAGTRLLDAAARWLAEAGFAEASLWVLADNHSSRRFYEWYGWRGDVTTKPFDYGEGESIPEVRYITRLTIPAG
jgi:GNAT superfamily N-acetyltransferase